MAVNPQNPNTIFSGGFGLFASYDHGNVWYELPTPSEVNDIRVIVFHPQDTSIKFMGGFNDGVWKTTNAGASWSKVLTGVNFNGISLVLDPQHPDTIHAGSFDPTGLHTSFDGGETWFVASDTLTGFCSLTIHPDSAHVLIGGTTRGTVSKSRDYGKTWRLVTARSASEVPRVIFDPLDPDYVYGSVLIPEGDSGFIRSKDGGETWEGAGLFNISTWALCASAPQLGVIYLGGFFPTRGSVSVSKDRGDTWQTAHAGLPANGDAWMLEADPGSAESVYLAMQAPGRGAVYRFLGENSRPLPPENIAFQETGTGTTALLRWNAAAVCSAAVARYWVFYGRTPNVWTDSVDAGPDTTALVSGLQEGIEYSAAIVAVDFAGRRSGPTKPVQFIPQSLPSPPRVLNFKRRFRAAELSWPANPELDIAGYNIYRAEASANRFEKLNATLLQSLDFTDANLPAGRFSYFITAEDLVSNESPASPVVTLRPVTLSQGILVVDESRDGDGSLASPSDAQIDEYYRRVLHEFAFAEYDLQRSGLPNDTLGAFSTIIWHADTPTSGALANLTSFFADYLDAGGKVLLSGWNVLRAFTGNASPSVFAPQDFAFQYLHLDSTWLATSPQFQAAVGVAPAYGTVRVDSAKVPVSAWKGRLNLIRVFAPGLGAETIYTFSAADPQYLFQGRPVGFKFITSVHKIAVLGFPLYYMREEQARAAVRVMLTQDFGENTVAVDEPDVDTNEPRGFILLPNFPNPFRSETTMHFHLPQAGRVQIEVFDLLGRFIDKVADHHFDAGNHALPVQPRLARGGVYFYRLTVRQEERILYRQTRKLVFLP
ncbi:MAG: T9SS type A sorting domain-containing protein [bacterium]